MTLENIKMKNEQQTKGSKRFSIPVEALQERGLDAEDAEEIKKTFMRGLEFQELNKKLDSLVNAQVEVRGKLVEEFESRDRGLQNEQTRHTALLAEILDLLVLGDPELSSEFAKVEKEIEEEIGETKAEIAVLKEQGVEVPKTMYKAIAKAKQTAMGSRTPDMQTKLTEFSRKKARLAELKSAYGLEEISGHIIGKEATLVEDMLGDIGISRDE